MNPVFFSLKFGTHPILWSFLDSSTMLSYPILVTLTSKVMSHLFYPTILLSRLVKIDGRLIFIILRVQGVS